MSDKDKELVAVVDLVVDAIKDGIDVMADGQFNLLDVLKLQNLLPDLLAAVSGLGMVPAEIKALTFDDGSALVAHIVGKLAVTNTKALAIISASLHLAASAYELVLAIKAPAQAS